MGRQLAIAVLGIVLALFAVSVTVVAAASWLQRHGDEPPTPPRVATAFGQVTSLISADGVLLDGDASPVTFGPAALSVAGGTPLEVPPVTPVYGSACDLLRTAIGAATTPIAPGTELVTPELPPCFVQVGVAADGRVEWLLAFATAPDGGLAVSGDLRGVQAELLVLEDGSTVPGATAPLTGCESLAVTTVSEVAALDADVEIRVDPATGAAIDVACTF